MPAAPPSSVAVAVRCRPLEAETEAAVSVEEGRVAASGRCFQFKHCFGPESSQEQIFHALGAPLVDRALSGYNACVFAYGQTGSGKTHTMSGSAEAPGLIPRLIARLFERVAAARDDGMRFSVDCSFWEIHNERLRDLLREPGKPATPLEIHETPAEGVHVSGLLAEPVTSAESLTALFARGSALRATAATACNAESSRSHAALIIRLVGVEELAGGSKRTIRSALNLVDLAGSERASKTGVQGEALKEGASINKSLSALGNVINALSKAGKAGAEPKFVPYRDSKLTRVLQESLSGNSSTVMIAAVSPAAQSADETVNTLQFAERAAAIQLKAKRNEQTVAYQLPPPPAPEHRAAPRRKETPRPGGRKAQIAGSKPKRPQSRRACREGRGGDGLMKQTVMRDFFNLGDFGDFCEEDEELEGEGFPGADRPSSASEEAEIACTATGEGAGVATPVD